MYDLGIVLGIDCQGHRINQTRQIGSAPNAFKVAAFIHVIGQRYQINGLTLIKQIDDGSENFLVCRLVEVVGR